MVLPLCCNAPVRGHYSDAARRACAEPQCGPNFDVGGPAAVEGTGLGDAPPAGVRPGAADPPPAQRSTTPVDGSEEQPGVADQDDVGVGDTSTEEEETSGANSSDRLDRLVSILTEILLDKEDPQAVLGHLDELRKELNDEAEKQGRSGHWLCAMLNQAANALEGFSLSAIGEALAAAVIDTLPKPLCRAPLSTILQRGFSELTSKMVNPVEPTGNYVIVLRMLVVVICPGGECEDSEEAAKNLASLAVEEVR